MTTTTTTTGRRRKSSSDVKRSGGKTWATRRRRERRGLLPPLRGCFLKAIVVVVYVATFWCRTTNSSPKGNAKCFEEDYGWMTLLLFAPSIHNLLQSTLR